MYTDDIQLSVMKKLFCLLQNLNQLKEFTMFKLWSQSLAWVQELETEGVLYYLILEDFYNT